MYKNQVFDVLAVTAIALLTGFVIVCGNAYGQTSTTSDLTATLGNESNMDASLPNHTLPSQNVTTAIPITPP